MATAKTLREAGVPVETMFGDIGDPEPIHEGLCARFGARGRDDILHVRSFLDHDRPFLEPSDEGVSAAATSDESDASYVRVHDGSALSRALVYRNLVSTCAAGRQSRAGTAAAARGALAQRGGDGGLRAEQRRFTSTRCSRGRDSCWCRLRSGSSRSRTPVCCRTLTCFATEGRRTRASRCRLVPAPSPCEAIRLATAAGLALLGLKASGTRQSCAPQAALLRRIALHPWGSTSRSALLASRSQPCTRSASISSDALTTTRQTECAARCRRWRGAATRRGSAPVGGERRRRALVRAPGATPAPW